MGKIKERHSSSGSNMTYRKMLLVVLALLLSAALGCHRQPQPEPGFRQATAGEVAAFSRQLSPSSQNLSGWEDLGPAVQRSLEYVSLRDQNGLALDRPELVLTWGDLRRSLEDLLALLPELERRPELLREYFLWLKLDPQPLLTGYYEPLIVASLEPREGYPYPLYGLPADLRQVDLGQFHPRWAGQTLLYRFDEETIRPYFGRQEIDSGGALQGRGIEIAWTKDPVDIFFLQIQGSGKLLLPDGTIRSILYSGKNGREYVSLGKVLIKKGMLLREEVSMQAIRRVLAERPDLAGELMETNPSYVFFRLADEGPYGSMNKRLTPWVSVASDLKVFPLGSIAAMTTELPAGGEHVLPFRGLVLPQDTGGAIIGHRMDLFCGAGEMAEQVAGHLQSRAGIYLLVHRDVVLRP
jgi:membrane-bound lytic murein transglycosylase A